MIRLLHMFLAALATTASAGVPEAIFTDPPKDAAHPASMATLQIMSHGSAMNAVFYLAAGAGPHPTVLFLHGSPGNEQNLDLAQAIRRAGWNVLTLHYRGSWGSAGTYSIANSIEDGQAALAFLRAPSTIAQFGLAPGKIVLIGHSMGGFIAAKAGAEDPGLMGVGLIAAWDVGDDGPRMAAFTKAQYDDEFGDMAGRVVGATGHTLVAEQLAHRHDWAFPAFVPGLAKAKVLIVTAHDEGRDQGLELVAALKARGGQVTAADIDTDHPFSDARIALQVTVLDWLAGLSGPAVAVQVPNRTPLATIPIAPAKTVSRVEVTRVDFAPGQAMPMHKHSVPVICIVAKGSFLVRIGDAPERPVGVDGVTLEPADMVVHYFRNASATEPSELLCASLAGDGDTRLNIMLDK